ncbi:MAG: hypothetical protein HY721_12040 [Planctomycetes bacterium]|nr:hypothetical protein [Planctomycetota bacterium]
MARHRPWTSRALHVSVYVACALLAAAAGGILVIRGFRPERTRGKIVWCLTPHGRDDVDQVIAEIEKLLRVGARVHVFLEQAPMDLADVLDLDSRTPDKPLGTLLKSENDLRRAEVRFLIDQVHGWNLEERRRRFEGLRSGALTLPDDTEMSPQHPNWIAWLQGSVKLTRYLVSKKEVQVLLELPSLEATYASLECSFAERENKDVLFQASAFDERRYVRGVARLHELRGSESALRDRGIVQHIKAFLGQKPGASLVVYTGPAHEAAYALLAQDRELTSGFILEVLGSSQLINDPLPRILDAEAQRILRDEDISAATRRQILAGEIRQALILALESHGVNSAMATGDLANQVLANLSLRDVRQAIEAVQRPRPGQDWVAAFVDWLGQSRKLTPFVEIVLMQDAAPYLQPGLGPGGAIAPIAPIAPSFPGPPGPPGPLGLDPHRPSPGPPPGTP